MKKMNLTFDVLKVIACGMAFTVSAALAGEKQDTKSDPKAVDNKGAAVSTEETKDYNNWIELSNGSVFQKHGNVNNFKRTNRISGDDYFGGLEDLHYDREITKGVKYDFDARAIYDNRDYKLKMGVEQQGVGFVRAGYTQYRTWYDGHSVYLPNVDRTMSPWDQTDLAIDRGSAWAEIGLRMPDVPEVTVRYEHEFRDGKKDSTIYGQTTQLTDGQGTRKIVPSFRDINEQRDILKADAKHHFGKTEAEMGMRYEYSYQKNRLNIINDPSASTEKYFTQTDKMTADSINAHGGTTTRFDDNLWVSTAYSHTSMQTDLGGMSRIPGNRFNADFDKSQLGANNSLRDAVGGSLFDSHVANMIAMWVPIESLTVTPSVRLEKKTVESGVLVTKTESQFSGAPDFTEDASSSDRGVSIGEGLDLKYNGIKNWVFYTNGEWEQEEGRRSDANNLNTAFKGTTSPQFVKDDNVWMTSLLRQKYTAGANWYATREVSLTGQYYFKRDDYDQDIVRNINSDDRILGMLYSTHDVNFRVNYRPTGNLAFVTRYDHQYTEIETQWRSMSQDFGSYEAKSADIKTHMFSESATWSPYACWQLQATGSYVLNETDTPIYYTPTSSGSSGAITQDGKNNYYVMSLVSVVALDNKTDFQADYNYYHSDNYVSNWTDGLPLNSSAIDHQVAGTLTHRLNERVRLLMKYAYVNHVDEAAGGMFDYDAHMIYGSVKMLF